MHVLDWGFWHRTIDGSGGDWVRRRREETFTLDGASMADIWRDCEQNCRQCWNASSSPSFFEKKIERKNIGRLGQGFDNDDDDDDEIMGYFLPLMIVAQYLFTDSSKIKKRSRNLGKKLEIDQRILRITLSETLFSCVDDKIPRIFLWSCLHRSPDMWAFSVNRNKFPSK